MNPKTEAPPSRAGRNAISRRPKSILLAGLAWCICVASLSPTANAQGIATDVTGPGDYGINYDITQPGSGSTSAVLPGAPDRLYAGWLEPNVSGAYQVRVSVYNSDDTNPSWTRVDRKVNGVARPANQGINRIPTATVTSGSTSPLVLAVHNSMLYATWVEALQVRVARYNGIDTNPNWDFVDGNAASVGINVKSAQTATSPSMMSFGGKLHVSWSEMSVAKKNATTQIRVKAYNGTTFSFVESGGTNGINHNSARSAYYPSFGVLNDSQLFVCFLEPNATGRGQVRVKAYAGGTTWNSADGGGENGVNHNPTRSTAGRSRLIGYNSKLYLVSCEDLKIRVARFDGSSWINVDGNQPFIGLNYNQAKMAITPTVAVHNGLLYVAWTEATNTINTSRMKVFNGNDAAPLWTFTDGGGNEGIVMFSGHTSSTPGMASSNSKLYVHWSESPDINVALMNNE